MKPHPSPIFKNVTVVVRVALGAVFLFSCAGKIADPAAFAAIVTNYQLLSPPLVSMTAVVFPWIEAVCGLALVFGRLEKGAALLISLMMVFLTGLILYNGYRGLNIACGCFSLAARNHHGEKQPYLPSRKWVDGSVSDDMPAKRLARLYGVNHFVVSQTNPHVIPFVADGKKKEDTLSLFKDASVRTARAWLNAGASSLERPLSLSPRLTRMTNIAMSVLNQDYVGDINILPPSRLFNPFRILAFLSEKEILDLIVAGERATWPRIEMIRIQTRISRALAHILDDYDEEHIQHVKAAMRKKAS